MIDSYVAINYIDFMIRLSFFSKHPLSCLRICIDHLDENNFEHKLSREIFHTYIIQHKNKESKIEDVA